MAPPVRIAAGRFVGRHPVAGEHGQEDAQKVNVQSAADPTSGARVGREMEVGITGVIETGRLVGVGLSLVIRLHAAPMRMPKFFSLTAERPSCKAVTQSRTVFPLTNRSKGLRSRAF